MKLSHLLPTIEQRINKLKRVCKGCDRSSGASIEELSSRIKALREEYEREQRINRIESELYNSPRKLSETLDHITHLVKKEFEFSRFDIVLIDPILKRVIRRYSRGGFGYEEFDLLGKYGALGVTREYALNNKDPWIVNDIKKQDPLWEVALKIDVWIHGTFPLYKVKSDGTEELVGSLHGSRDGAAFMDGKILKRSEVDLIQRLGRAVTNAIHQAQTDYFESSVLKISAEIGSTRMGPPDAVGEHFEEEQIERIFNRITSCLNCDYCNIFIRNPEGKLIPYSPGAGLNKKDLIPLLVCEDLIRKSMEEGRAVIENEVKKAEASLEDEIYPVYTTLIVPIIRSYSRDGRLTRDVIGVMQLVDKKDERQEIIKTDFPGSEGGFSTLDQRILEAISPHIETIISNTSSYQELKRLSRIDGLTGLYNHSHFVNVILERELDLAERAEVPLSLVLADIDHFKILNDVYGHLVGDLVLEEVGKILRKNSRTVDYLARYGGEEFAFLLPFTDSENAQSYAKKILQRISEHDYLNLIKKKGLFLQDEAIERFVSIMNLNDTFVGKARIAVLKNHFGMDFQALEEMYEKGEFQRIFEIFLNSIRVTMSMGIACCPNPKIQCKQDLIDLADHFLLKAKESGRNQCIS